MNRRKFLSLASSGAASALCGSVLAKRSLPEVFAVPDSRPADFTLRIAPVTVELAPGKVVKTVGYNGTAPGPVIRLKEGVPVTIDAYNDTDQPDLVHWHGLAIDSKDDGA